MEIKIAPAPTGIETTQELDNTNATMTVFSGNKIDLIGKDVTVFNYFQYEAAEAA